MRNNEGGIAETKDMREKTKSRLKTAGLVASGVFIGAANGFFGGGGGMLAVPALQFLGGAEEKKAHATAIAVILPLSIVTAVVYTVRGTYAVKSGLAVGAGVIIGGVIGALLLRKLPAKAVNIVFYVLMLAAGVRMLF